jgi:hypothetical protein
MNDMKKRAWSADPLFIPHPDKYLRNRRWEDEASSNGASAPRSSLPDADDVLRAKGLL